MRNSFLGKDWDLRHFKPGWTSFWKKKSVENYSVLRFAFPFASKNTWCKGLELSSQYVVIWFLARERNSSTPFHWATTRKCHWKKHHGIKELTMPLFSQISPVMGTDSLLISQHISEKRLKYVFLINIATGYADKGVRYSAELHESPCYCPILGFSSACGLAHRTAPSHPCLAWGSRGSRCAAGTQKWAANCWHLEWKRSISQIIWSLKAAWLRRTAQIRTLVLLRCGQNGERLLHVKSLMVLERTVCQSWAFHLQPQSNSALGPLWNSIFSSDQMAQIKAKSMSAFLSRHQVLLWGTQENHRNGWKLRCSSQTGDVVQSYSELWTSQPQYLSFWGLSKAKFRAMWARTPGHTGQTAWSFGRCSWKRLWTHRLLFPRHFHLSPDFLGLVRKKV